MAVTRPGESPPTLESVYRAYAPAVARIAARLWGPGVDVEDVVHDVFLVVQRRLASFDPRRAQLATWLYGITANVVHRRRRAARLRRLLFRASDAAEEVASPERSALDRLQGAQDAALVYRTLDGLNEKYRTVLILYELEGFTGDEIAALMGQRVSTIWVWLHRARAQFLTRAAGMGGHR